MARAPAIVASNTAMTVASKDPRRGSGKGGSKQNPATAQPPKKRGKSLGWVQGWLCGVAAAMSPPTALAIAILLAPGLAALMIDDRPSKPVARTMLLFGLSGGISPLVQFWQLGHGVNDAITAVMHPQPVLTAWMAGGFGWLLTELAPLVVSLGMGLRVTDERSKLKAASAELAKEWGLQEPEEDADATAEGVAEHA